MSEKHYTRAEMEALVSQIFPRSTVHLSDGVWVIETNEVPEHVVPDGYEHTPYGKMTYSDAERYMYKNNLSHLTITEFADYYNRREALALAYAHARLEFIATSRNLYPFACAQFHRIYVDNVHEDASLWSNKERDAYIEGSHALEQYCNNRSEGVLLEWEYDKAPLEWWKAFKKAKVEV